MGAGVAAGVAGPGEMTLSARSIDQAPQTGSDPDPLQALRASPAATAARGTCGGCARRAYAGGEQAGALRVGRCAGLAWWIGFPLDKLLGL